MFKISKLFVPLVLLALFLPFLLKADEVDQSTTFKAKVVEVMQSTKKDREDGSQFEQQDLKLVGLDGDWQGKEIIYKGVSEVEVANTGVYKIGDKVYVDSFVDEDGQTTFYVVDLVRTDYILLLTIIFVVAVVVIGGLKGFKALLSLVVSFVIIIEFILPQILAGRDPFIISLIGGLVILGFIIYLTEGFKKKSHIAIITVLFSLFITLVLSIIFTKIAMLSGLSQEEAVFLIGQSKKAINFQGLLLAGFVIGAIGVLDDIIIGQIEAVEQIKEANPDLPAKKVFSLAYKVGNTHLGAIINTLFLTYTGASLPLLLLFVVNQETGLTFGRLVSTEVVSTEIIRTLVGSVGIILSMPIATFLATLNFRKKRS